MIWFRDVGWFWFPLVVLVLMAVAIYAISGALPRKTPPMDWSTCCALVNGCPATISGDRAA